MVFDLYVSALSGLSLGVASAAHCALMCGPLAMSARLRGTAHASVMYFGGRLVSYVALGALAGGFGRALLLTSWVRWFEALLSWLLAATLLWAAWSLWSPRVGGALVQLGRGPRRRGISALIARVAHDPLLLGVATALLPCAALFAAVTAAAATGSPVLGALSMLCFALVTGAAVVTVGKLTPARFNSRVLRRSFALVFVAGALITGVRSLPLLNASASERAPCPLHAGLR